MRKTWKIWLALLVSALLLTACSEPPTAKVTEAKSLIDAAVAAGGEEFAPQKMASIKKNFEESLAEIKYQDSLTFKNYATATYMLNQLMDECDQLRVKMAEAKGETPIKLALRIKPGVE